MITIKVYLLHMKQVMVIINSLIKIEFMCINSCNEMYFLKRCSRKFMTSKNKTKQNGYTFFENVAGRRL